MSRPIKHGNGWRVRWLDETGRRQSETLKDHKTALAFLRKKEVEVDEIQRGLRLALPPPKKFTELADYYLAYHSSQKRRYRDDLGIVRTHLRPYFGEMLLPEIGKHVEAFKLARRHLSPKTVNNHLTLLISMLNVAHELGWLTRVPKIRKPKIPLLAQDFRYLKTDEEISRFLITTREMTETGEVDRVAYPLYATAIYTGERIGELAGLTWDSIDFERRLITIFRSYEGVTKNGETRHVPILTPLLPILKEWRLRCPGRLVFPNQWGNMLHDSSRVVQEMLHRVLDRAGFPRIERNGKKIPYITFHCLRHTFASHWMMKNGNINRLQRVLGHKTPTMTQRYSHLSPEVFAEDYDRFGTTAPGLAACGQVVALTETRKISEAQPKDAAN